MSEKKTPFTQCFPSDYLASDDLEDGRDLVTTIKKVTIKPVKNQNGESRMMPIAELSTAGYKPMVLNKTNCKVMQKFTGSKYLEDWKNVLVAIYVDHHVRAYGEEKEGLRLRTTQPRVEKPELTPEAQNWDQAIKALKDGKTTIEKIKEHYFLSQANQELLLSDVLK